MKFSQFAEIQLSSIKVHKAHGGHQNNVKETFFSVVNDSFLFHQIKTKLPSLENLTQH